MSELPDPVRGRRPAGGLTGLDRIRRLWREHAGRATTLALLALTAAVALGGAHLARLGTTPARLGAALALLVVLSAVVVRAVRERRDWRRADRTISRALLPAEPELGRRALRALSLVDRTERDESAGSGELARLHFERLLQRASAEALSDAAQRHAQRYRGAALALLVCTLIAIVLSPLRVVEGLDVMAAHAGRAPVELYFLRYPRITAQPPAYTRQSDRTLVLDSIVELPKGTAVTVRGVPRYQDRRLVLTDGTAETPFVSDASGGLVARYTVGQSAVLRVASRYGDVLIEEPERLTIRTIPDLEPIVVLEGAPRTLRLSEVEQIDLRWLARDDYGLRQVDLVLRSGAREDRRVLGRFDGDSHLERGGHVLRPRDPFLRRMFLPVTVTIQARDDDPFDGPKWGISDAIVLLPPAVGEPEALRFAALLALRDELLDLLVVLLDKDRSTDPKERRARSEDAVRRADALTEHARKALDATYGGLSVPRGLGTFAMGQMDKMRAAFRQPDSAVKAVENTLLSLDVALRGLAARDAEQVAKRLGDVADEAATGARYARETENRAVGVERLDTALAALAAGAAELARLGELGEDVGAVAESELRRIRRAREAEDLMHTELASLHLAARLRRPMPSFGAAGGAGVESGMSLGDGGEPSGPPSSADQQFDQLAEELRELAREHGDALGEVERALRQAAEGADVEALREEARRLAEAVREAVQDFPPPGQPSGSRAASEALAREHASALAHGLEKLSLEDAIESGRNAASALEHAQKSQGLGSADDEQLEEARQAVDRALDWARKTMDELRRKAEQSARGALDAASERERELGRRAGSLAEHGRSRDSALPESIGEQLERAGSIMQEAARAFAERRGERGLELQREAQRLLERSQTGRTTDAEDEGERSWKEPDSRGDGMATGGEVPDEERRMAEDFRDRVLRGLSRDKSDRLSPAIQRYAEGLLR